MASPPARAWSSQTKEEAATVATEMLSGRMLGEAGARVVLEEFLKGDELSFLVFSDGERVAPLVAAQDHKRVGRWRHRPEHRRHGRLLHARNCWMSRCATGCCTILRARSSQA